MLVVAVKALVGFGNTLIVLETESLQLPVDVNTEYDGEDDNGLDIDVVVGNINAVDDDKFGMKIDADEDDNDELHLVHIFL